MFPHFTGQRDFADFFRAKCLADGALGRGLIDLVHVLKHRHCLGRKPGVD